MSSPLLSLKLYSWPQWLLTLSIELIPLLLLKKSKFPFSSTLKYYIKKKSHYFRSYKKTKTDMYCGALVKIAIKFDRQRCLKSDRDTLKLNPVIFGNIFLILKVKKVVLFSRK
jgi:hypothetical protein